MAEVELKVPLRRKAGALWESLSPWILGVGAGVALWWFDPPTLQTAQAVARFLDGSIAAAAVLSGFQVTALSLLLAIADRPVVVRLRRLEFYDRLIGYHWVAIVAMFVWLLGSLVLLLVVGGSAHKNGGAADLGWVTRWSAIVLLVAMVAAICASYRVTRLLILMLRKS